MLIKSKSVLLFPSNIFTVQCFTNITKLNFSRVIYVNKHYTNFNLYTIRQYLQDDMKDQKIMSMIYDYERFLFDNSIVTTDSYRYKIIFPKDQNFKYRLKLEVSDVLLG